MLWLTLSSELRKQVVLKPTHAIQTLQNTHEAHSTVKHFIAGVVGL